MRSRINRLGAVFQLAPRERIVLARAWGLFLLVPLALRILPFTRLLARWQKSSPGRCQDFGPVPSPPLPRLVWLVEVAARYSPLSATCLTKALVLSRILGGRGIVSTLRIGIARHDGASLTAHAWLERNGEVILGQQEAARHAPLLGATFGDRPEAKRGGTA